MLLLGLAAALLLVALDRGTEAETAGLVFLGVHAAARLATVFDLPERVLLVVTAIAITALAFGAADVTNAIEDSPGWSEGTGAALRGAADAIGVSAVLTLAASIVPIARERSLRPRRADALRRRDRLAAGRERPPRVAGRRQPLGRRFDRQQLAAGVVDLERRVVQAELVVEDLLDPAADLVAVVVAADHHVRRERDEAAGDLPDVEVVDLVDADVRRPSPGRSPRRRCPRAPPRGTRGPTPSAARRRRGA